MNARHSGVTDWGLAHISIGRHYTILDVGCGGGRTLSKLAGATEGKVYGIDYSEESVAASKRTNARWIDMGRVEVRHGAGSHPDLAIRQGVGRTSTRFVSEVAPRSF
jgi:2-polyprenyl-3-methyl-5-hydroxy-6-metoxy-1,4-benzoquinol methylase